MRLRGFIIVLACLTAVIGFAGDQPETLSGYDTYVNALLDDPALRGASWSVLIRSLNGDSIVYARDPDRRLIPASAAKVVTSAAVLDALGPNYRFETTISSLIRPGSDGTLKCDLHINAGGDPMIGPRYLDSLGAPVLKIWADSLKAAGVQRVQGNIVLRTWPFQREVDVPEWEVGDVNDRFGPPVDGFGFNSNVSQLGIFPGTFVGANAVLSVDPPYAPLEFRSTVVTSESGTSPAISMELVPEDTVVILSGQIPRGNSGQYLWVAMQNPALFFGRALYHTLTTQGIEISGDVKVEREPYALDGTLLFAYRSPPLSEILKVMNKESDNFIAEYVLRAMGVSLNKSGDLRSGLHAEERFLKESGINDLGIELHDGCGLARQDLCSAAGLVELLKAMYVHPSSEAYIASLSISGVDGTIGYRLSLPEMIGKVHAKTGTINQVSNLVGYMYGENGQVFVFAILCNNFPSNRRQHVRNAQDAILERLYFVTANQVSSTEH